MAKLSYLPPTPAAGMLRSGGLSDMRAAGGQAGQSRGRAAQDPSLGTPDKASFLYPANDFCYIIRNFVFWISADLENAQTSQLWDVLLKERLLHYFCR